MKFFSSNPQLDLSEFGYPNEIEEDCHAMCPQKGRMVCITDGETNRIVTNYLPDDPDNVRLNQLLTDESVNLGYMPIAAPSLKDGMPVIYCHVFFPYYPEEHISNVNTFLENNIHDLGEDYINTGYIEAALCWMGKVAYLLIPFQSDGHPFMDIVESVFSDRMFDRDNELLVKSLGFAGINYRHETDDFSVTFFDALGVEEEMLFKSLAEVRALIASVRLVDLDIRQTGKHGGTTA